MAKFREIKNPDNTIDAELDPRAGNAKTNPIYRWTDKEGTTQRCGKGAFDELYESVPGGRQ